MKVSEFKDKVKSGVIVASATALPVVAFANEASIPTPDVSKIVTYITVGAVAAVVAIGAAKQIPAAAMWLYNSLTSMIKRG